MGRAFLLVIFLLIGYMVSRGVTAQTTNSLLSALDDKVDKLVGHEFGYPIKVNRDYYMVFRIQPGIGKSAYDKFMAVGQNDDNDAFVNSKVPCACRTTDGRRTAGGKLTCDRHYRSKLLDQWRFLPIERVRVGVYKDDVEKRFWEFDATGTDTNFHNWFAKKNLLVHSYTDLSRTIGTNFDSMEGEGQIRRRFFLNKSYGGCENDFGWLVVKDGKQAPCTWEKPSNGFPAIHYSKKATAGNWNSPHDTAIGDLLVISIKLKDTGTCAAA